jgi:chitin deacetylase
MPSTFADSVQGFVDGPKSPGLMMLQHELYDNCVTGASSLTSIEPAHAAAHRITFGPPVFKNVYPSMVSQGWNLTDIPGAFGLPQYKNALTGQSDVVGSIGITNTTAVVLGAAAPQSSSGAAASSSAVSSVTSSVSSAAGSASSGLSRSQSGSAASRSSSGPVPSATNGATGSAEQASAGAGSAASPVVRQAFGAGLTLAIVACVASILN